MRLRALLTVSFLLLPTVAAAQNNPLLNKVLSEVRSAYNKQQRPMVIFDLEGTLFDNRPRHLKILQEYGKDELESVRPKAAQKLENLTLPMIKYRLTDTLKHVGVKEEAVVNNAAVFWSERFFSNKYLKYDKAQPGAVNFVRNLYSKGARIVYLTGRDVQRQLEGTVKALHSAGFPIGIQGTELIMKPTAQTQDAVFKQQVTNYMRHYGKVIASFDNEPANANVFRRAFPKSICVLYSAPHSPNPPPLLPKIQTLAAFQ